MAKAPLLFLHGGPGFNNAGERSILAAEIRRRAVAPEAVFWEEPEGLSGPGAFDRLVASAEASLRELARAGKVHVIGHSFGAITAHQIASRAGELVSRVTLVAPTFDLVAAHRRILRLAEKDLAATAPARAARLGELLGVAREVMDEAFAEGFLVSSEDPALFLHYWVSQQQMQRYFAAWQERGLQLKVEAFASVLSDLRGRDPRRWPASPLPASALLGERDPVFDAGEQLPVARALFPGLATLVVPGTAHFPHLEDVEGFLSFLERPPAGQPAAG